ncbi:MAG: flavodoxin family protein [Promethearchaeota archaeon]
MKISIIYDSKFGNNKKVAESIAKHLKSNNDVTVGYAKDINPISLVEKNPEVIIFGGPIHADSPSQTIKKWIKKFDRNLSNNNKKIKKSAAFAVRLRECNVDYKWRKIIKDLSIYNGFYSNILDLKVIGTKGPLEENAESKIGKFSEGLKSFIIE